MKTLSRTLRHLDSRGYLFVAIAVVVSAAFFPNAISVAVTAVVATLIARSDR